MENKTARKTDRRTLYTRMVIKEALISLMREKPFPQITVKELCARAEINRGTLYLHYLDLPDVLDSIENEIVDSVRDKLKTINLFDESLSLQMQAFLNLMAEQELSVLLLAKQESHSHLLEKIIAVAKENVRPEMQERLGLSEDLADCLFTFLTAGSIAATRESVEKGDFSWTELQALLHKFTVGGMQAISNRK